MPDTRLRHKIQETRKIASDRGLDLASAPLLVTFEMPIWGIAVATAEMDGLARLPGTAVAVMSVDALPRARRAVEGAPNVHVVAERGLVCGQAGGATMHVYPTSEHELEAFAVALFAGIAPADMRVSLAPCVSSGRQEVTFEGSRDQPAPSARELKHAIREHDGMATFAGDAEDAVVVDDSPAELEAVRAALTHQLAGHAVRVMRMPSGRFRVTPEPTPRAIGHDRVHVVAQTIAISSDRFLEMRGEATYGFATEPVAKWEHGPEAGARRLAEALFGAPDTVITQLGLHPFTGEGTLFFAYEGSETIWEAANKGVACVMVRDILEYGRILRAIRTGEE